jgi:hypothetical protein
MAFASQFEEVDRAIDNLTKSGKGFGFPPSGNRRESMPPIMAQQRPYPEFGTVTSPTITAPRS